MGENKSFGGFSYFVLVLGIWHLYHCFWPWVFFFFCKVSFHVDTCKYESLKFVAVQDKNFVSCGKWCKVHS